MTQTVIIGTSAVIAASMIGAVILFRKCQRKRQRRQTPVMTFRELYADNAVELGI